jgi:glycosyltransferase involved in cell wall biosynthesis
LGVIFITKTLLQELSPKEIFKDKLIIIVIGTLNGMGGAERQAILLAEHLNNSGYNVKLLALSGGDTEQVLKQKNIDYVVYPFDGYQSFTKNIVPLIKLIFFLRKLKPFAFIPFITLNSKYIGLIWKFTGAKFACWNQRDEGREVYGSRLEKISANNVPVIISNSLPGKDAIIKKVGISKNKIKIINNGIEIPSGLTNEVDWRQLLNLSPQTKIVSMLASIYKYKDHTTLLKAWKIVLESFCDSPALPVLILAGTFKGMENQLKTLCYDLRIANNVYFIGATPHTNALIEQSELVVHSSNKEGCPNAVLEAMALSKPVIATDIPGNVQAMGTKYANYCLSKPNNHHDFAIKTVKLLNDENLNSDIGSYNLQRIKDEFSINKMVNSYLQLIKENSK